MAYQQTEDHASTVRNALPHNILVDIAARAGYLLTRLAVPPFILAHVPLAAYGLWTTAFVVVSYLGISTMGLSSINVKYIAEFTARGDFERANRLLKTGLLVTVPTCAAAFCAIWLLWPSMAHWLHIAPELRQDAREVILSVVAIFLTSLCLSGFRDALVAVQRTAQVQIIWIFSFSVETVLIFVLVAAGRGIRGLAEAFLARTMLEIAGSFYLAIRQLPWLSLRNFSVDRQSLRLLFAFGGIVQLLSFLAVALNSVERLMAAPLVGLEATALLDLAKKLPAMASSVPLAFASSLVPAASFLHGGLEGSIEQRRTIEKLYYKGARYMSLAAGVLLALPAAFSSSILHVWIGKQFAGAALLMAAFCLSAQMNLLTGPGTSILRGIGRFNEEFFYALPNVVLLAITLPLSRLLIGHWSAVGIGCAVAISTSLAAIVFLMRAHRLLQIPLANYWKQALWPGIFPYVVSTPLVLVTLPFVRSLTRWEEAGALVLIGLIYLALVLLGISKFIITPGERIWFGEIFYARLKFMRTRRGEPIVLAQPSVP